MEIRTSICLLLILSAWGCAAQKVGIPAPKNSTEELRQTFEPQLKSILPTGWTLALKDNIFELVRGEKAWVYSDMQRPSLEKLEETVRNAGREEHYTITLRFVPLLPREEYQRLKQEREPYEKIMNEGRSIPDEWAYEFQKRKIPIYHTDKYSIYADKSDGYFLKVYPASAATECKQVLQSLDTLFQRYEKRTGKNSDF